MYLSKTKIQTMKTSFKTILFSLFVCLISPSVAKATHLLGGEIVWRCQDNGSYVFTMTLYRDCGGVLLPYSSQTLENNAGVSIVLDSVNSEYLLPSCYANTTPNCGSAISGEGYMEKVTYQSGEIILHGAPPAGGWYFNWSSCCRPNSVSNLINPGSVGYHLRAYMYPVYPTGSTSALSAGDTTAGIGTCYDSSPYFLEGPQSRTCANQDNMLINNLGLDSDLDSLYYRFASPLTDSGVVVPWDTGYYDLSPLPSGIGSAPAQIDSLTGVISFNSSMTGSWATCVEVESWRGNYMVSKVYRDIPIFTLNCLPDSGLCASSAINEPPSFEIINDTASNPISLIQSLSGDTLFYKIAAIPGDTISFSLLAKDLSPHANCQSEQLSFVGFGATLSDSLNYSSTNSCLLNGPCATLSSTMSNGGFTGNDSLRINFDWTVSTSHLNPIVMGTIAPAIYPFYFKVSDDECPVNKSSVIIVIVEVEDPVSAAPSVQSSCISIDSTAFPILNWSPNPDTTNWGSYVVYGIDSTFNTIPLDTIYTWSTSTFIDSVNAPGSLYGYIIAATNPTFTNWTYSAPITSLVNTSIYFNGTQFLAFPGYTFYQWVRCDSTGYTSIPNANASSFTPASSGDYAVIIVDGTCNVISDCLNFISPIGVEEIVNSINMYPNPNIEGALFFDAWGFYASVHDLSGKVVISQEFISEDKRALNVNDLSKGSYIVTLTSNKGVFRKTLIIL